MLTTLHIELINVKVGKMYRKRFSIDINFELPKFKKDKVWCVHKDTRGMHYEPAQIIGYRLNLDTIKRAFKYIHSPITFKMKDYAHTR